MDIDMEQDIDTDSQKPGVFELEDAAGPEPDISYFRPMPSRKVWVILAVIFVTIAVAILYVYQAGDRKTILGNQPIPAKRNFNCIQPMQPVALHVPGGGGLHRLPAAGIQPTIPPAVAGAGNLAVRCPHCSTVGLPLCGSCGTVMQPLPGSPGAGLYLCPSCGTVGLPMCPRCRAQMTSPNTVGQRPVAQPAGLNVGGQFQCPACGVLGLPNWDPGGTPICPGCGAQMRVTPGGQM